MSRNPFADSGHIASWVFGSVNDNDESWQANLTREELNEVFRHLEKCHECRTAEIEAMLHSAEFGSKATRVELIESQSDIRFDNYPKYLLEHILKFSKGRLITFTRDDDDRVTKITGKIDDKIESESVFIYDGQTTSIHCFCNDCEDDSASECGRLTFADFHVNLSKALLIEFSLDSTEFCIESKEIKRHHSNHKIFMNNYGKVIRILKDNKPWYLAEFDSNQNLIKEVQGSIKTEFSYSENKILVKKVFSNDELIEHYTYEYADGIAVPVRIFKIVDSYPQLNQLNTVSDPFEDSIHLRLDFDGVARCYYDSTENLVVKVCLPHDPQKANTDSDVASLKELYKQFDTIELVLIDHKKKNARIIEKDCGHRLIDQTATYQNGTLFKIYNHKNAEQTTPLARFLLASVSLI